MSKFKKSHEYLHDFLEAGLSKDERASGELVVRPGVTWDGVEIFLGERMTVVPWTRLKTALDNGQIVSLAGGVLDKLRRNHAINDSPYQYLYGVKELELELYEQLHELALELGIRKIPEADRANAGSLRAARTKLRQLIINHQTEEQNS